jgi:hypothetical protein
MMFANQSHRTGLWPLVSHLFRKSDFLTNFKLAEIPLEQAVLVKVDLLPIGCLNEPITLIGK